MRAKARCCWTRAGTSCRTAGRWIAAFAWVAARVAGPVHGPGRAIRLRSNEPVRLTLMTAKAMTDSAQRSDLSAHTPMLAQYQCVTFQAAQNLGIRA